MKKMKDVSAWQISSLPHHSPFLFLFLSLFFLQGLFWILIICQALFGNLTFTGDPPAKSLSVIVKSSIEKKSSPMSQPPPSGQFYGGPPPQQNPNVPSPYLFSSFFFINFSSLFDWFFSLRRDLQWVSLLDLVDLLPLPLECQ